MRGKDIESIVVVAYELELGGKVADCAGEETKENGSGCVVDVRVIRNAS
jgi:hypothetical protein